MRAIVAAIKYAAEYLDPDIILMSLGWPTDFPGLRDACDYAFRVPS